MAAQPEGLLQVRGDNGRPIADREHAIDRPVKGRGDDRGHRSFLVLEAHRHRVIAPRVFEDVAPIGREREIDAEALGGLAERACLVAGRRRHEQDTWHRLTPA